MKFALEHCHVIPAGESPADGDGTEWPTAALLPRFAHCAQYLADRHINWPQSFARRQLPAAAYQLHGGTSNGTFRFKRKSGVDPKFPKSVTFKQVVPDASSMQDSQVTLHGEVLTYVEARLEIQAERRLASVLVFTAAVRALLEPDEAGVTWVFDLTRAQAFLPVCKRDHRAYFKRELLHRWEQSRSFWRIRPMDALPL